MTEAIWTLAKLSPEKEQMLKEAEATLGGGVLLAYASDQVAPQELTPSQLKCLKGLEEKLGAAVVAVAPG